MSLTNERTEEVRYCEFRAADDPDGRTLEGYAAVFNAWTDIRDAAGTYKERIAPGAFTRSLKTITPVLQFDHGTHPLLGGMPLGRFTVLREDKNGLFVRAQLSSNWLIDVVRDAIRDGGVTGMSFRFKVVKDEWGSDDDGNETRTIHEVQLLEAGPVVFPAYTQTSVAIRSLMSAIDDETRAELVRTLTDGETDDVDNDADDATSDDTERSESDTESTSSVADEPASDGSPDEPPAASHEDNRNRIAEALARFRQHSTERKSGDVDQ